MKIYYAHPISTYGSEQEVSDLSIMEGNEIVNPGSPEIQKQFDEWKKNGKLPEDHDMRFFKRLIEKCDALCYRGETSGVKYEITKAKEFGLIIINLEKEL